MSFIIKHPETDTEWAKYYQLRWRILRAPWGEPAGSEKDNIENECIHIMVCDDKMVIGIGRLQFNSDDEAQIRYMAVEKAYERQSVGTLVVKTLEQQAREHGIKTIVLDAREPAVGFYEKLGYRVTEKSYLLFNSIQHYRMQKRITEIIWEAAEY